MSVLRDSIFNAPGICTRCYMGYPAGDKPCPVCRNWSDERAAEEVEKLKRDVEEAEGR